MNARRSSLGSRPRSSARGLALALVLAACSEASDDPIASSGETTAGAPTTGSADVTTAPLTTESTGAPVGDGIKWCVETCTVPAECCVPGTPCPGPYPNNVACVDGLCTPAACADDTECAAVDPASVCRDVRGTPTCIVPCTGSDACATGTCDGVDDAGTTYCFVRCDAPGQFCGNQTCDAATGLCVCNSDGQCLSDWLCLD